MRDSHCSYRSPLGARYASAEMQQLWSDQRKFTTWRQLWLALARAQKQLGLDITDEQIAQLEANLDTIDYEVAAGYEKKLRHDVMAHVHALGDVAPAARPIIHLGATSQFVNCNTELLQLRDGLDLIAVKLARVIDALGTFAAEHRLLPTLAFTHYQPAQPTTVGKRAALWAQDLAIALADIEHRRAELRFRGVKGTTGTQASFLTLFEGNRHQVEKLDQLVTEAMGWDVDKRLPISGQTYPRLVDAQVLNALATAAAALHKMATDIRLLANRKELEEPFEKDQIGSSAMAYKRNPMRCERICGMTRFVMSLPQNALNTAAVQWFERTLDDSSNRRLVLPEAFLALDGALDVAHNVAGGLVVYEATVEKNLRAELPFMASEDIMMAAVILGADRQEAHEVIRTHAQAAAAKVKQQGGDNDLIERLRSEPIFAEVDLDELLAPHQFIGLAPQQVDDFIREVIDPIRRRYAGGLASAAELRV